MVSQRNESNSLVAILRFVTLTISLFVAAPVYAQVAGATLSGTVRDSSGAVIPNAKVSIKDTATGTIRYVTTDAAGFYSAPNLLPGSYDITTSAPAFSTQIQRGVTLEVGASQVLDPSLKVGQVSETVEVTGEISGVQLATSTISGEINATTVRELPLNGRDWAQLATLQPGIVALRTQPGAGISTSSRGTRGYGMELAASGHSPFQNNYRVNGISVNDYSNGAPGNVLGGQLGVDAIQEFSVLTANYTAEYGRTSGGVINAITRSGTNSFHGTAYWFLRDEGFDARNFFDPPVIPPFHRNDFGASGGAPIKKNKTFIFANYEGIRQSKSIAFRDTVPTAAARAGNLCSVPKTGTCTPNTIKVDPLVAPFLGFWPMPNGGLTPTGDGDVGFFNSVGGAIASDNYEAVRGDHRISDKDSLAASWFHDKSTLVQPDALLIGIHQVGSIRHAASLEWTHIFTPSLLNTARVGFNRTEGLVNKPVSAINALGNNPSLGITPGANSPILMVPALTTMQGALGDPTSLKHVMNSYQVYDDAFITRGNWSIKVGFAVEREQNNGVALILNGRFSFPSLQGFLLNQPNSGSTGNPFLAQRAGLTPGGIENRQTVFGAYVQNDWRVRPNLTLNLGVRYEPTTIPTEALHHFALVKDFYHGPLIFNLSKLWETNQTLRNFAPRVGFAWDPFHSGKTSLRGGFGLFDVLPLLWQYGVGENGVEPPYLVQASAAKLPPGSFPSGILTLLSLPTQLNARYVEQNPHRSYVMNWNLNVQRQITPSLTAMVGYIGSRSVHLLHTGQGQNGVRPTLTSAGELWPFPVGSGTKVNPNVGGIHSTMWDSSAYYSSFQAQFTKRMSHGAQAQASYTWGKCLDQGSSENIDGTLYLNSIASLPFYVRAERRGLCDFNVAHNFVLNYVWQLPAPKFGGAGVEHILGGWEVGGIFSASTGTPFSVLIAGDPLGMIAPGGATPDFPDRLRTPGCENPVNSGHVNNYLKLNCFIPPVAPASFAAVCQPAAPSVAAVIPNTCMNLLGNAGRNQLVGPGLLDFDFSLFKNNYIRRVSESFNVQLRFEFFNILNHPNFLPPVNHNVIFNQNGTPAGGAGTIDGTTTDARQIQFGLKLIW